MLHLIKGRPEHLPLTAWEALKSLEIPAERVVQTMGQGRFSGGTHGKDGSFLNELGSQEDYSCAFDLSVLHPERYSDDDIKQILHKLAQRGIAGWLRDPARPEDGWHEPIHIHAIDCHHAMKDLLQAQIHNWCHGLNGLVSHTVYHFLVWPDEEIQAVRAAFLSNNPSH